MDEEAMKLRLCQQRMKLLRQLKGGRFSLSRREVDKNLCLLRSCKYLCKANVLWEQERSNVIVPFHSVMKAAIEEICDEYPEDGGEDGT
uniref:Uncharacterized protein n=1 Tax=Chromera velia CCMP2878 TaxID=1169474 RepID=A0A0G4HDC4_9ALVE|eukprot:Cvel_26451.t1-p1 / transcript=Cvel_26451.t1 / gene=Cvel_26451 / organism=Chromera_velia_CCMP2878 / gene_product=hypothetical protein / transcript_product=hypothetical protein / location=Cvel_scaffold3145:4204-4467(-) / protein_length=88 / sequence_SO=supercontig / SO=protein_coding / is_pseudo=false